MVARFLLYFLEKLERFHGIVWEKEIREYPLVFNLNEDGVRNPASIGLPLSRDGSWLTGRWGLAGAVTKSGR